MRNLRATYYLYILLVTENNHIKSCVKSKAVRRKYTRNSSHTFQPKSSICDPMLCVWEYNIYLLPLSEV